MTTGLKRRFAIIIALAGTIFTLAPSVGWSWDHDYHHGGWGHRDSWHGRGHYHGYDGHGWHGGHWEHGWHGPHFGWWWIVGPTWFLYDAPIYPYPDPYIPPDAAVQPAQPVQPAGPPPTQYWYYCRNPRGYYPYVTSCPAGWQPVPAAPSN